MACSNGTSCQAGCRMTGRVQVLNAPGRASIFSHMSRTQSATTDRGKAARRDTNPFVMNSSISWGLMPLRRRCHSPGRISAYTASVCGHRTRDKRSPMSAPRPASDCVHAGAAGYAQACGPSRADAQRRVSIGDWHGGFTIDESAILGKKPRWRLDTSP